LCVYRKIYVDGEDKVCVSIGKSMLMEKTRFVCYRKIYVDGECKVCVFIGKSMLMERTGFVCL
jgi:hypothetical protein